MQNWNRLSGKVMLMLKRWEIGGKAKKAVLNSVLYSMSHRIKSWQSHNAHHSIKSWKVKRFLEAVLSHIAATEMMLFDFKPSECFTYNAFHLSHIRQSHPSWNAWHDALHKMTDGPFPLLFDRERLDAVLRMIKLLLGFLGL